MTTTRTQTGAASKWDQLWSDYIQAKQAGRDTTAEKTRIREWHAAKGWTIPAWAW